jgi:hypothetical protein
MIALLARLAMPKWLVQLLAGIALLTALVLGVRGYLSHVYHEGELASDARHTVIDAANTRKAEAEQARLNGQIAATQSKLDAARADVAKLQQGHDHDQAISDDRQRRLLAGTDRERVLIRAIAPQRTADQNGQAPSAGTGAMDSGSAVSATLDGRVASDLEWLRQTRNSALTGLQACIVRYDALKQAVDAMP